jgi:Na+/H+-dicarboxylate symporter
LVPIELAGAAALDIAAPLESQVFRGLSSSRVLLLVFFAILAGVGLALLSARSRPVAAREIAFSEVLSLVDAGRVQTGSV